jgi:hypothetical protein
LVEHLNEDHSRNREKDRVSNVCEVGETVEISQIGEEIGETGKKKGNVRKER